MKALHFKALYLEFLTAHRTGYLTLLSHICDLASVFKRLVANNISLKASKSVWATTKLPVLGHGVRAKEGITADPEKVKAILQTKKPDLSTELRSFIGQCEYQRKFIPCLYEYLAPLRAIVQDLPYKTPVDISDRWSDESSNAFDTLKVALAQDTVQCSDSLISAHHSS